MARKDPLFFRRGIQSIFLFFKLQSRHFSQFEKVKVCHGKLILSLYFVADKVSRVDVG